MAQIAKPRVGINGFGRIGRVLFRAGWDKLDIVGINNLGDTKTTAHLLKYDSTHGKFPLDVEAAEGAIIVGGKRIPVSATKDPAQIPWGKWEVDLVLDCTGAFKKKEDFEKHLAGGAKKVLVSAPAPGSDLTFVMGVNHQAYDSKKHTVVSNASCTTNCLAPMAKVLHETFGIEKGFMTTVHSYTNDQNILDADHNDLRRARAAAVSMIPTTTGAAKTVGEVMPELKGKIDGTSVRVPTPNVSLVDFVFTSTRKMSVAAINEAFSKASEGNLKGIMRCEKDPLVSIDFNGDKFSTIIDMPSTMVMGDNFAKVFAWYDNEAGFSNRMVDACLFINSKGY